MGDVDAPSKNGTILYLEATPKEIISTELANEDEGQSIFNHIKNAGMVNARHY